MDTASRIGSIAVNRLPKARLQQITEFAREWIEPSLPAARAEEITKKHCQSAADFEWYRVSTTVGNVKNNGPELLERLSAP